MYMFGHIYRVELNDIKLKKNKTKIKLNFITKRAYSISLEPKNRNRTEKQMST